MKVKGVTGKLATTKKEGTLKTKKKGTLAKKRPKATANTTKTVRLTRKVMSQVPSCVPQPGDNSLVLKVKASLTKSSVDKRAALHHTITSVFQGEIHAQSYCSGSEIQHLCGQAIVNVGGGKGSKYVTDFTVEQSTIAQRWLSSLAPVLGEAQPCNFIKMEEMPHPLDFLHPQWGGGVISNFGPQL